MYQSLTAAIDLIEQLSKQLNIADEMRFPTSFERSELEEMHTSPERRRKKAVKNVDANRRYA